MKAMKLIFAIASVLIIASSGNAQYFVTENDAQYTLRENQEKLSAEHKQMIYQADKIRACGNKDLKKSIEDTGVLLQQAKHQYADIENTLNTRFKKKTNMQHKGIKKDYSKASMYYKGMADEAMHERPNLNYIRKQAKKFKHEIKGAERQNKNMKYTLTFKGYRYPG